MGKRPKMLASVVRELIAPVLRECPEQCKMVSITEVDVSADFSYATVYISALECPDDALVFLNKKLPQLMSSLGQLYRKKLPELRFRIDGRTERGELIDTLLAEAEEGTDN